MLSSSVAEFIVLTLSGILVGYVGARWQQRRKILETEVSSMPLLRFKPSASRALHVLMPKEVLSGAPWDEGEMEEVANLFGFEVTLHNAGNDHVEAPQIEIVLHESGRIVEYETQPADQPGYRVTAERDDGMQNVLRVNCQYINPRDRFLVRLISTDNEQRDCKVNVLGAGVRTRRRRALRRIVIPLAVWGISTVFLFGFAGVPPGDWRSGFMISYLGARVETQSLVLFPLWLRWAVVVLASLAGVWATRSALHLIYAGRRTGNWDTTSNEPTGISSVFRRVIG